MKMGSYLYQMKKLIDSGLQHENDRVREKYKWLEKKFRSALTPEIIDKWWTVYEVDLSSLFNKDPATYE